MKVILQLQKTNNINNITDVFSLDILLKTTLM